MSFSLNELEAMGKRAARGAGFSWGLAEEAGKAVRWLIARGLPGAEQLVDILTQNDKRNYAELVPTNVDGIWQAPARHLCPLITGAALCDRATEIAGGRAIKLGKTAQPLLLIPYVAGAVNLTGATISITWDDVVTTLSPAGESIEGDRKSLTIRRTEHIHCQLASQGEELCAPINDLALPVTPINDLEAPVWNRLAAFAQRTYAPATEASRLAGAGAGLSDNN